MLYKCKICEKEFKQKCHYTNHLNRIRPCVKLTKKIQDLEMSFWENYYVIIAGLDNVEARRYLNQIVHSLV